MDDFLKVTGDEFIPLRDIVFKTLRKAILKGELPPGERLMEIHLSQRMGVSRTPIREAIRMLELEGLVTMIPRRGATVARITLHGMQNVLEVRGALDRLAIELACERITNEELLELKNAEESFENSIREGNVIEIANSDAVFHERIMKAAKNEKLLQTYNNLSEQVYRYRYECVKNVSIHKELVREHRDIFNCLKNKDKEKAVRTVMNHISKQEEMIIELLNLEQQ